MDSAHTFSTGIRVAAQGRLRMCGGLGEGEEVNSVSASILLLPVASGRWPSVIRNSCLRSFVDYAMHRVRLLRHHGITPFIVFDGGPLPAKKGTENLRAACVASTLQLAMLECIRAPCRCD